MKDSASVFVVGGTGFLGYHAALEFLARGHRVATVALPDVELGEWFPQEVDLHYGDVFVMAPAELERALAGQDVLVYAVGPDDRIHPPGDPYRFFHERLVVASERVVTAARNAGVGRCVVLGSYFTYFDRLHPERRLAARHPYIRCRAEQAQRLVAAGGQTMDVMVLELPYIFGAMPGRVPLWKEVIVKMLYERRTIYYPRGGSAMITVANVAEGIAGAAERGRHGERYPMSAGNLSWVEMIRIMLAAMDMAHKRVVTLPDWMASAYGRLLNLRDLAVGQHSGLDLNHLFADIMTRYLYIDPEPSMQALGHGRGDLEAAIVESVRHCVQAIEAEAAMH